MPDVGASVLKGMKRPVLAVNDQHAHRKPPALQPQGAARPCELGGLFAIDRDSAVFKTP